jgi:rRNA maturation endonuclease Nob1
MTIEKAIYQLGDLIKDRESFCQHDDFDDIFLQDIEACKMGIQALEKQVPKKVIWKYAFYWACCPNCKNNIYDEEKEKFKFCPDCGQALEWSD